MNRVTTVKIEVSDFELKELLRSALDNCEWVHEFHPCEKFRDTEDIYQVPFERDGYLTVTVDDELVYSKLREVDRSYIVDAIEVMAADFPSTFGDFLQQEALEETAELFLQLVLFGEVIV